MALALQLHAKQMGIEFDITKDLQKYKKFKPAVMFDEKIQLAFKHLGYPKTHELMKTNIEGTLLLLHSFDLMTFDAFDQTIVCDNEGSDGKKVWSDYKKVILQHLEQIQPGALYEEPRQKLAQKIHSAYYNKYPRWPRVGDFNYAAVPVSCSGGYNYGDYFVAWSVEGSLVVMDLHPDADTYECKVSGNPTFKVIHTKLDKLLEHEKHMKIESNFLEYEGYVNKLQKKYNAVTFGNHEELTSMFKKLLG